MRTGTRAAARALLAAAVATGLAVPAPPAAAGRSERIAFARVGERGGIWSVTPAGRDPRRLTQGHDSAPTWSPDGRLLALRRWGGPDETYELFVVRPDGSGERRVGTDLFGPPRREFTWSPDSTRIAYWTRSDTGVDSVVVVDVATGDETTIEGASEPAWAPEGDRIAFAAPRDDFPECGTEVYTSRPDGSGRVQVSDEPFANDHAPTWSPEGSGIAFLSSRDHDVGHDPEECDAAYGDHHAEEVYAAPAGGGDATRLTRHNTYKFTPVWSPTGPFIAYTAACSIDVCDQQNNDVFVVGADGGRRNLTRTARREEEMPAWSPDGNVVVYASSRGVDARIEAVKVRRGNRRIVYESHDRDFDPHWRR